MSRAVHQQRGQATTEYALLVAVLVAVLFVPYLPGPDDGAPVSVFGLLIQAFDIYIDSFHTGTGLPIP